MVLSWYDLAFSLKAVSVTMTAVMDWGLVDFQIMD